MQKSILLKTNLLVCLVIIVGFSVISAINYQTNRRANMDNIEQISVLTSDGIRYRMENIFTKPINISMTMASSLLLKDNLIKETPEENEAFIQHVGAYLNEYKKRYEYDSVFLVSSKTNRYYNHSGVDRVLYEENPENGWFYSFLESDKEYSINVDNDEASHNNITVFINGKIENADGTAMGVVGVGFQIDSLQNILQEYAKENDIDIYLINENGDVEIAIDNTGWQPVNFFDICGYPELKEEILGGGQTRETSAWWIDEKAWKNYVTATYIPEINWHLIVEHNTNSFDKQMNRQFFNVTLAMIITGMFVLSAITYVIGRYNKRIVVLTTAVEQEKQAAFRKATEQLYENIYEFNVTKNQAMGNHTKQYFESLGLTDDTPYDKAVTVIAQRSVNEEYRNGYISIFSQDNVLREFEKGNTGLKYDLLSNAGSEEYYWLRIMAHIYYRKEDDSVCMFTYRKNIDAEKRREVWLAEQAQIDGLTNLYNKMTTEQNIKQMIGAAKEKSFAFFILDIDNFKQVNDRLGHAFGDVVLSEFAAIIKKHFRDGDLVGRIGGDEFVIFLPVPGEEWTSEKVASLSKALDTEITADGISCKISASIGVALTDEADADYESMYKNADAALYETKRRGKNGFVIKK